MKSLKRINKNVQYDKYSICFDNNIFIYTLYGFF
jgi:hypothetical protein